jgi:Cohesin domain
MKLEEHHTMSLHVPRFLFPRFALPLALFSGWGISAQAQTLSIASETVDAGGVATVALDISDLSEQNLGTYDIDVGFNASILRFDSVSYGDPVLGDQLDLEGFGTVTSTTSGPGTVDLFELSLDSPDALGAQNTRFTLATLTFDAVGTGTSALSLLVNALGDQDGNSILADVSNGAITVSGGTTVQAPEVGPEQALSALTLLTGALAILRRRSAPRAC